MVKPHIADVVEALASAQQSTDETIERFDADLADFAGCLNDHADALEDVAEVIDEHADTLEEIIDAISEHADVGDNHAKCLEAIYAELDELDYRSQKVEARTDELNVRVIAAYNERAQHRYWFDVQGAQWHASNERFSTFIGRLRWLFTGR